jgi:methyltransferase (TIGR00027 family)
MRAFMAVRSRFAEDQLAAAVAEGTTQYVVLGAGLDTFACRNPHSDLRVFEVDHPATQRWKREQLQAAGITVPSGAVFVPIDFEHETLGEALELSGFRMDHPAFFSWLGVVPYLSERAFADTLNFIVTMPKPCGVVFDYGVARSVLIWKERFMLDALAARVAAAGEPFRLFFEPQQLAAQLRAAGFTHIDDLGSEEINQRYFSGRSDGLQLKSNLGRLLSART